MEKASLFISFSISALFLSHKASLREIAKIRPPPGGGSAKRWRSPRGLCYLEVSNTQRCCTQAPSVTLGASSLPEGALTKEPTRALFSQGYRYITILHAGSFRHSLPRDTSLPEGGLTGGSLNGWEPTVVRENYSTSRREPLNGLTSHLSS